MERARLAAWQHATGFTRPTWACELDHSAACRWRPVTATVLDSAQLVYLYSPKAASSTIVKVLTALGRTLSSVRGEAIPHAGAVGPGGEGHNASWQVPHNYTVFTFVREPLSLFLAGYAETVERNGASPPQWTAGGARRPTYIDVPCAQPTRVFEAFLDDLLGARALGLEVHHAWPQLIKTDVALLPPGRGIDFVGRVEHLHQDVARLFRRFGVSRHVGWRTEQALARAHGARNTKEDKAAAGVRSRCPDARNISLARSMPLLCGLLAADYLALRELYPPPASCGGAEGLLRAWGEVNQRWAAAMRNQPQDADGRGRDTAAELPRRQATPHHRPSCVKVHN